MASSRAKWYRRILQKCCPFLFKRCPDGNFHWWYHQVCWCRVGEHSDDWHGGVYSFVTDEELHRHADYTRMKLIQWNAGFDAHRDSTKKIYVVFGGIGTGKTHKAIDWLRETPNGVIVVMSASEANRLQGTYGLDRQQVVTWSRLDGLRGRHCKLFWDNLDLYMQTVSRRYGCELGGWSATVAKATDLNEQAAGYKADSDPAVL